jgi:hypothetical protein
MKSSFVSQRQVAYYNNLVRLEFVWMPEALVLRSSGVKLEKLTYSQHRKTIVYLAREIT